MCWRRVILFFWSSQQHLKIDDLNFWPLNREYMQITVELSSIETESIVDGRKWKGMKTVNRKRIGNWIEKTVIFGSVNTTICLMETASHAHGVQY